VAELVYAYDSESYSARIGSSSLPAPTMNVPYTLKYVAVKSFWFATRPIRRAYGFIFRPLRRSVKVLIKNENNILLVRPNYAHRNWTLPGGKVRRGETYENGAQREVLEETGIGATELQYIGEYETVFQFQPNTVKVFLVDATSTDVYADGIEIKECKWFPIDDLPSDRTPRLDSFIKMYKSYVSTT
jgi:ADP-ribose pyrophosphatase YjhB (NUDIX family)